PQYRDDAKNQTLSFLIGPPTDPFRSQFLSRLLEVLTPRAMSASSMLSAWRFRLAYAEKSEPEKRLPPSRGMMLTRTAPVGRSAVMAPISYENSCTAPVSMFMPP